MTVRAHPDFFRIMRQVQDELKRQDGLWGEQNHPHGTGSQVLRDTAKEAREFTQKRASEGNVTWQDILFEEVCEAFAEKYPKDIRRELVEVIAVAVQWIEAIDRETSRKLAS